MKFEYELKEIGKEEALCMIRKYHYSNTLPKINKYFLGFFLGGGTGRGDNTWTWDKTTAHHKENISEFRNERLLGDR